MESTDRTIELSILYELSALPMGAGDPVRVGELAVDQVGSLLESDRVVFYLYRPETDSLCPLAARGIGLDRLTEMPLQEADQALVQAASGERPLAWSPGSATQVPNLLGGRHVVRVAMGAPVRIQGELSGFIYVTRRQDRPFVDPEQALLALLASRVADALDRLNSCQALERRVVDLQSQYADQLETWQRVTRVLTAVSEVARAVSTILDLDELLSQVVEVVRERFDLYYAGLFLLDESQRWAVLRAGTGEAGWAMLGAGYKLEVGGESMVGACIAQAEPQVGLDVEEQAVRLKDVYLPATRSEVALPLVSRGEVVGAITAQSERRAAFSQEDITALQTIADQIAMALDNARLFSDSQVALAEMEAIQQRYVEQAWAQYMHGQAVSGYEQAWTGLRPLGEDLLPEVQQALAKRQTLVYGGETEGASDSALVVPVVLRGQPIGALGLKEAEGERRWSDDDIALAQTIAQQLALAAENLRLIEETQRRAVREELIGRVTARIRRTLDLETVLRTATREMREVLDLAETEVWVGAELMEEEQGGRAVESPIEEERLNL